MFSNLLHFVFEFSRHPSTRFNIYAWRGCPVHAFLNLKFREIALGTYLACTNKYLLYTMSLKSFFQDRKSFQKYIPTITKLYIWLLVIVTYIPKIQKNLKCKYKPNFKIMMFQNSSNCHFFNPKYAIVLPKLLFFPNFCLSSKLYTIIQTI